MNSTEQMFCVTYPIYENMRMQKFTNNKISLLKTVYL